jgi:hypothetical protein
MNKPTSLNHAAVKKPCSIKGSNQFNKTTLAVAIAGALATTPTLSLAANPAYTTTSKTETITTSYTADPGGVAISLRAPTNTLNIQANQTGGAGSDGLHGQDAVGLDGSDGGNGGTGGTGGDALTIYNSASVTNNQIITGGTGGTGGKGGEGAFAGDLSYSSGGNGGKGGDGGNGGVGILVSALVAGSAPTVNLTNLGIINGGTGGSGGIGGSGGYGDPEGSDGSMGYDGDGGNGITVHYGSLNLNNSGSIAGGTGTIANGIYIYANSAASITNTGAITAGGTGGYSIANGGALTTLNNAQGGNGSSPEQTALTYSGALPTHYNIIIQSNVHYGQLQATNARGNMLFGISNLSDPTSISTFSEANGVFTVSDVASGVSSSLFTNTNSGDWDAWGIYDKYQWKLDFDGQNWNLLFRLDPRIKQDTQNALQLSASALSSVYALQESLLNFNLQRDCNNFDQDGICTLVQYGRSDFSGGDSNTSNNGSLVVAYQTSANSHIGAYLDKTLSISNNPGVDIRNGTPAFGAFAVWQQNTDNTGWRVRLSAGASSKDLNITRQAFTNSEAGQGKTSLDSYGAALMVSDTHPFDGVMLSPYMAVRYTRLNSDAYTENATTSVTAPLTYSALTESAVTALLGVNLTAELTRSTSINAGFGVEHDMSRNHGQYQANSNSIAGLTPIALTEEQQSSIRPTASVGMQYQAGKATLLGVNLSWTQTAYATEHYTNASVYFSQGF